MKTHYNCVMRIIMHEENTSYFSIDKIFFEKNWEVFVFQKNQNLDKC